jgi:hypothetical protein
VGYLNTADGVGAVLLGALGAFLVGRRLGPVIAGTTVMVGVALAATAFVGSAYLVLLLLAVAGGARVLYDVATRTLLQRSVPAEMVARIFGFAECVGMAGLAIGSLLTPLLVAIGGSKTAVVGVALLLPLVVGLSWRFVQRLDAKARVPIVEIALLRSVPLFAGLPAPALEGVAQALRRRDVATGDVIIREGDTGEDYYAIAEGTVDVSRDGAWLRTLGRGSGVGEIALLERCPRTATVVATTPGTVFALDRTAFLTAVNAHVPTHDIAVGIVDTHLHAPPPPLP